MNHTKGEWLAYLPELAKERPLSKYGTDKRILVLHPDGQRIIADLSCGYVSNKGPIPKEERENNARLIQAAPEMLEALKEAYTWLTTMHRLTNLNKGGPLYASIERVKEAIQKSNGANLINQEEQS